MCGIIGAASLNAITDRQWLSNGCDTMQHRGPDDAEVWWSEDGRVGLGHRRLAIIDLSSAGHQPMQDARGEMRIVFNGEIYNFVDLRQELISRGHSFRSHSDTEVILAAYHEWGTDCLSRLNGMFSFALYDGRLRQLFLARDRAGEKPLFYTLVNGLLRFASELKGLMADLSLPRRIDPEALDCYLAMGFVPGDRCILKSVNKLPPAHALTFNVNNGKTNVWQYWTLPDCSNIHAQSVDKEALLEEFEFLLGDSVRRQLIADVPIGILLSGGVDSSLVTAMAVRTSQKIRTFTIRFPGHDRYDETAHARLIARHFATEHVELEAEPSTVDLLPLLARQFDEPIIDSSMIPTFLVSRLVRQHCTVALGGDGGDELFGGYRHYCRLLWLKEKLGWIPLFVRRGMSRMSSTILPLGFKGYNWMQALGEEFCSGLPLIPTYFSASLRRRLLIPSAGEGQSVDDVAKQVHLHRVPVATDLLQRATRMDFMNYLAEDILVKVDRASMMNSLEVRSPFLDYRIIEFAFRKVPSPLKSMSSGGKILAKMLAKKILPPNFNLNRKQGFSIPLADWLDSGPWKEFFRDVLQGAGETIFNRALVDNLLSNRIPGQSNGERLFALVLFELWRREYRVVI